MTYILVIALWWGNAPAVEHIEFESQPTCEMAKDKIREAWGWDATIILRCVQK